MIEAKKIQEGSRGKSSRNSVIAIVLALLLPIIIYKFFLFPNIWNDLTFNENHWKQFHNSRESDNPRGKMYEDLRSKLLDRRPPKEVVLQMLGEPDFSKEDSFLSYNLGMWSGFRVDYDSIDIYFDENGVVMDVKRVQH